MSGAVLPRRPVPGSARPWPVRLLKVLLAVWSVTGLLLGCAGIGVLATSATAGTAPAAGQPLADITDPADAARPATGRVVLIGADAVGWAGVSPTTPELAALAETARRGVPGAAVGSLSVRGAETPTCPVDGWSTLSAGVRASGPARPGGRCPALPEIVAAPAAVATSTGSPGTARARVAGWSALAARDRANAYRAALGTLGTAVSHAGRCLTAVGPGAAIAGASTAGTVARYLPAAADLDAATLTACPLTLVDAGSGAAAADRALRRVLAVAPAGTTVLVATIADGSPGSRPEPALGLLAEQTVDGRATSATRSSATSFSTASFSTASSSTASSSTASSSTTGFSTPSSSTTSSSTTAGAGHLLTSGSTDWPGVAALTDLTPTLLAELGIAAPAALTGAVITPGGGTVPDLGGLRTVAVRARVAGAQVETWFTLAGISAVLLVLALAVRGRRPDRWPAGADRVLQIAAGVVFCLPVSTRLASLVPWWRVGAVGADPGGADPGDAGLGDRATAGALWAAQLGTALVLVVVVLIATPVGTRAVARVVARVARSRWTPPTHPRTAAGAVVGVLAAVSTVVVVIDVAIGSPLSRLAVIGLLPIDGSRFHGFGNEIVAAVDSAVLLGASIAVGPLVRRGRAVLAGWMLAAAGLAFAAVDGLPGLGDDFGGVPAGVVGAGVSALVVAGSRLRPLRLVAVGGAAVVLAVALALGDAARGPGRRTHVGDFVADLAHGTAGPILSRKAGSVVGPFAGDNGPVAAVAVWVGLAVVLALGVVVLRPAARTGVLAGLDGPWPAWRAGLAGTGAAAIVGSALNDSGIIVALVATGTAVAAVTAVLTGTAADERRGDAEDPSPVELSR